MKKATALLKRMFTLLSSITKAKSMAIKDKTNAFKARLLVLSLMKHKKLAFCSSFSDKIHSLLGHNRHEQDDVEDDDSKAIILYNAAPCSSITRAIDHDDDDDNYPDLRHTLFEGEEEFEGVEEVEQGGGSIIEMVRSSKEEEGKSFSLEDEIDHVADLFITRFHKQMKLQKLLSFKRYQEMLTRST
ncbi:PREDICTED: uncharacterized protein LOC104827510 [Tarenaya hassleriana]|uniref:uncharacterized protein LOC104827510 n=1 Tax=Tarenaya hassleriana TaxID=28532 RepID=UPI00053C3B88|nr:PREDICTED: uncharacterized protein LOC104827510 [Tarenaya hassleriana]